MPTDYARLGALPSGFLREVVLLLVFMNAKQQWAYDTGYEWAQSGRSFESLLPGAYAVMPKGHVKKFFTAGFDAWHEKPEVQPATTPDVDFYQLGWQLGRGGLNAGVLGEEVERYIDPDEDTAAYDEALDVMIEGHKVGQHEFTVTQCVIIYTDAPESFDGFGTFTLDTGYGETAKGPIRQAAVHQDYLDWQTARYGSGMYLAVPPEEFEEIKDLMESQKARKTAAPQPASVEAPPTTYTYASHIPLDDYQLEGLGKYTMAYDDYYDIYRYDFERGLTEDERDEIDLYTIVDKPEITNQAAADFLTAIRTGHNVYHSDTEQWVDDYISDLDHDSAFDFLNETLAELHYHSLPAKTGEAIGAIAVQTVQARSGALPIDEILTAMPQNRNEEQANVIRELMRYVLGEREAYQLGALEKYDEVRDIEELEARPFGPDDDPLTMAAAYLGDVALMGRDALVEYVPSVDDVAPEHLPSHDVRAAPKGVLYARTRCGRRPAIIIDYGNLTCHVADPDLYLQQFPGRFVQVGLWETADDKHGWNN